MASYPGVQLEAAFDGPVAGVDEVGVACLAGPVVAAAVVFPPLKRRPRRLQGLTDSKQMTRPDRERLSRLVAGMANVGIGAASAAEVDRLNIHNARMLAMRRAVAALRPAPAAALVDGIHAPDLPCAVKTIVKGDQKSLSIAAASVVAKVARDGLMARLACRYAGYGWPTNVGYGTDEHYLALLRLGPTPHHRRSFAPLNTLFAGTWGNGGYRFDRSDGGRIGELRLLELRQDLHAVFAAEGRHVGVLKNVRGRWTFRAVGYDGDGEPVSSSGPLAAIDGRQVEGPKTAWLEDLLQTVA